MKLGLFYVLVGLCLTVVFANPVRRDNQEIRMLKALERRIDDLSNRLSGRAAPASPVKGGGSGGNQDSMQGSPVIGHRPGAGDVDVSITTEQPFVPAIREKLKSSGKTQGSNVKAGSSSAVMVGQPIKPAQPEDPVTEPIPEVYRNENVLNSVIMDGFVVSKTRSTANGSNGSPNKKRANKVKKSYNIVGRESLIEGQSEHDCEEEMDSEEKKDQNEDRMLEGSGETSEKPEAEGIGDGSGDSDGGSGDLEMLEDKRKLDETTTAETDTGYEVKSDSAGAVASHSKPDLSGSAVAGSDNGKTKPDASGSAVAGADHGKGDASSSAVVPANKPNTRKLLDRQLLQKQERFEKEIRNLYSKRLKEIQGR